MAASGLAMREEPAGGAVGTAGLAEKAQQCEAAIAIVRHQRRQASEEPAPPVAASGLAEEPAGGAVGTAGLALAKHVWDKVWDQVCDTFPWPEGCTELATGAAGAAGAEGTAGTAGLAVPDGPLPHHLGTASQASGTGSGTCSIIVSMEQ